MIVVLTVELCDSVDIIVIKIMTFIIVIIVNYWIPLYTTLSTHMVVYRATMEL